MAKFNYAKMRATAERLLSNFGFAATLTKRTRGGSRMRPGAVTETEHSVIIVDDDIRTNFASSMPEVYQREGGGLSLTETQRIATMSTSAGITPEVGDTLTVAGAEHAIKDVKPYAPGGTVMFYSLTADSAG